MPAVPNQPSGNPRSRVYVGILFDQWTPQVEAQMLKDVQQCRTVADSGEEVVVCCTSDKPDPMLRQLDTRRVPTIQMATFWIVYRTKEDWPASPDWCTTEVHRDLYVPLKRSPLMHPDENNSNGYYLPPQGRLSPDTLSLDRPAPNGYISVDPSLIMIWSKVLARLRHSDS